MIDAGLAAAMCLGLFAALSFHDGVIVHLVIERLPLRPAARLEHHLHTARAVLFPAILVSYFGHAAALPWGLALLAVDQLVEVTDMAVERRSRAHTGGLPSGEYVVHGLLITFRSAAIAFAALAPPDARAPLDLLVRWLLPGALLGAALHVLTSLPLRLLARVHAPLAR